MLTVVSALSFSPKKKSPRTFFVCNHKARQLFRSTWRSIGRVTFKKPRATYTTFFVAA
jgi:hypothetical protein